MPAPPTIQEGAYTRVPVLCTSSYIRYRVLVLVPVPSMYPVRAPGTTWKGPPASQGSQVLSPNVYQGVWPSCPTGRGSLHVCRLAAMGRQERKHRANRGSKVITFDENARKEFITGFRKRKNERRQYARRPFALPRPTFPRGQQVLRHLLQDAAQAAGAACSAYSAPAAALSIPRTPAPPLQRLPTCRHHRCCSRCCQPQC